MDFNRCLRGMMAVLVLTLLGTVTAFGAKAANGKKIQFGPDVTAIAKKSVDADPNFAFGYYLLATTSPTPEDVKKYSDKAVELAKNASEGERRYIEAVLLTRAQKPNEALPIFLDLAKTYPNDRMVRMLLGQVYTNLNKLDEARAAFAEAVKLDGST